MSARIGSDQAHSLDGHENGPVRTHTRTRSSTISGVPSSNTFPSEFLSFGGDGHRPSKLRKTFNRPQSNRGRANSTIMLNTGLFGFQSVSSCRPATAESHIDGHRKSRGSVLIAATDALGLKIGRRKLSVSQHPQPIVLPEIIDISAARVDAETEERKRLREIAAQAIGLQSYTVSPLPEENLVDEEEQTTQIPPVGRPEVRRSVHDAQLSSTSNDRSMPGSTLSVSNPNSQPSPSRLRSGSVVTQSPATTAISPIPPYPSILSSLTSFRQCVGTYPKFYPPSSLRIFALSKTWKPRYLVMSSPATLVTRGQSPAVSYLHLFKSGNPDELELERLEINEDSVVFVAEDEVGGKRSVIKVGGADVGAMKKEYLINENGYSMWLLQMQDTAQAHQWITNVKNAILSQRTVRAGLIPAYALGANEPRGDMDVMLSIRAQGIVMSVPKAAAFENSSLSSRSVNSLKSSAKPPSSPTSAVSALKGFFTTSRPRSTSGVTHLESERHRERDIGEESLASRGNNLLSILRSNTPDSQSIATVQGVTARAKNPEIVSADYLDRKILTDALHTPWKGSMSQNTENVVDLIPAVEVSPLEPPPRRRWASGLKVTPKPDSLLSSSRVDFISPSSKLATGSSTEKTEFGRPSSLYTSSFQFGTPEQCPRASSLQSISTYGSGEYFLSVERSGSGRQWSEPGIPPRAPQNDLSQAVASQTVDRAPSPNPSKDSRRSFVSALPSFSKRASESGSSHSANSLGMHQSGGTQTMRARNSVPPPRPAPTSALPPAPIPSQDSAGGTVVGDVLKPLEAISRSSFRASLDRPLRLSLVAPNPPPNSRLPPRLAEYDYPHTRRLSSESKIQRYSNSFEAIPASPFPPPSGPLPLPPSPTLPLPQRPVDPLPPKRIHSFKQRLRILSTSSASNGQAFGKLRLSTARISTASSPVANSQPTTPITEKNMPFSDSSFLQMCTPIMSTPPTPPTIVRQLPPHDQFSQETELEIPAVTSLSPPPRRGSRQLAETELPLSRNATNAEEPSPFVTSKQMQGSVSTSDSLSSLRSHDLHIPEERSSSPDIFSISGNIVVSSVDSHCPISFSPDSLISSGHTNI